MGREAVLNLVTGREKTIKSVSRTIESNLTAEVIQHIVLTGVRGMGKSFLLRYFQIVLAEDQRKDAHIDYILFPEEQRNIKKPSAFIYEILNKMQKSKESVRSSFEFKESPGEWETAVEKLNQEIKQNRAKYPHYLLIVAVENFDVLLQSAFKDEIGNSKIRKLLNETPSLMLLGASLKYDIDTLYSRRLFMAFHKEELTPWTESDFIAYFEKRLAYAQKHLPEKFNKQNVLDLQHKLKSISKFSGGSPRISVVLTNLIFDGDVLSVLDLLEKMIEEFTVYYTTILDALPPKSELLLDVFIKNGENMTQSELAKLVDSEQSKISQAFKELTRSHIVKKNPSNRYVVADRILALFYYKRYINQDLGNNRLHIFSDFLVDFYKEEELKDKIIHRFKRDKEEGLRLVGVVFGLDSDTLKSKTDKETIGLIQETPINNIKRETKRKLEDRAVEIDDKSQQIGDLREIGLNYTALQSHEKAIEYHQEALAIAVETDDKTMQIGNLGLMGLNYKELQSHEKAIECHQKALEIAVETDDKTMQTWNLGHVMECLLYIDPSQAWNVFLDEKYEYLPKNEMVKEMADAVVYREKWGGIASGFKMAKSILSKLSELLSEDEFFDSLKGFFAGLLNMKISDDLLCDIAMEFKTGTEREQLIAEAVLVCIDYKKSDDKEKFLRKQHPDLAILVQAIAKGAGLLNLPPKTS